MTTQTIQSPVLKMSYVPIVKRWKINEAHQDLNSESFILLRFFLRLMAENTDYHRHGHKQNKGKTEKNIRNCIYTIALHNVFLCLTFSLSLSLSLRQTALTSRSLLNYCMSTMLYFRN